LCKKADGCSGYILLRKNTESYTKHKNKFYGAMESFFIGDIHITF